MMYNGRCAITEPSVGGFASTWKGHLGWLGTFLEDETLEKSKSMITCWQPREERNVFQAEGTEWPRHGAGMWEAQAEGFQQKSESL